MNNKTQDSNFFFFLSFELFFCLISFDILRHSTRNTKKKKQTKSDKVLLQNLKNKSETNRHGKTIDHTFGGGGRDGGGNKNSSAIFLQKNRQFYQ